MIQLTKWVALLALLFCASVLALPFIFFALAYNKHDAEQFIESTGKAIGRQCSIDLGREP